MSQAGNLVVSERRQQQSNQQPRVRAKRPIACEFCRQKKVRCNGTQPCTNCLDRNLECVISARYSTKVRHRLMDKGSVAERLARVEALLQENHTEHIDPTIGTVASYSGCNPSNTQSKVEHAAPCFMSKSSPALIVDDREKPPDSETSTQGRQRSQPALQSPPLTETSGMLAELTSPGNLCSPVLSDSHSMRMLRPMNQTFTSQRLSLPLNLEQHSESESTHQSLNPVNVHDSSLGKDVLSEVDESHEGGSISSNEMSNWEYHGPKSYLSICSDPGIDWVIKMTGASHFRDVATTFMMDVTRRLKIERRLSLQRTLEPEPETAWRYARAYFDKAADAALGIVHRPWFESRLRVHLTNASDDDDDPAWYALRNIIYASGCRIELSRHKNIRETNQEAWKWFANALSVHTEILYFQSTMVGVQALTLMAYFSENIGSPTLEYMLCSNALRLAVSKGLHRQVTPSSKLGQDERSQRNLLFWAIYCLEKHIVSQSGRPSIIDDGEVNCQVPTVPVMGSSANLFYCDTLVRLAQLSSLACKRAFSYQAFHKGAKALVEAVAELDELLQALKSSIQHILTLDTPVDPNHLPSSLSLQQTLYLQYAYFNTVLDVHTVLALPWSQNILGLRSEPSLGSQLERSTQIVAKACQDAILATKYIHLDASTPLPLAFFGPMNAIINLFIYILKHPEIPRIQSDIALLNIGAGHFARLEFATDAEVSFPFVTEIAAIAREAVKRARSNLPRPQERSTVNMQDDLERQLGTGGIAEVNDGHMRIEGDEFYHDKDTYLNNEIDPELDKWCLMLPFPTFDDEVPEFLIS